MKIAYIITRSNEIGGAHIHVRDLSCWLRDQGHDVKIYAGGHGSFIDLLEEGGLAYVKLKYMKRPISFFNDILAVRELVGLLREFQPDVVAAHSAKAGVISRIASSIIRVPCVFTAHGWSFTEGVGGFKKVVFRLLEKILAPLSRLIITVCDSDRNLAISSKVSRPNKIRTIHNGMHDIDTASLVTDHLPNLNSPTLVMVARFEDQKDHETLIESLARLKDLNWNLQLVGDGPLQEKIKLLVSINGLEDRVWFMGRRQDVPEILEKADIFLLTTNWEGFPMSILEAMRAGLPVVATAVAGVPEAVEDRVTGYLVRPKNSVEVSLRVRQLLESEILREELGRNGQKSFKEKFTFEKMARATIALYSEIAPNLKSASQK